MRLLFKKKNSRHSICFGYENLNPMKTKILFVSCLLLVQFISARQLHVDVKETKATVNHQHQQAFLFFNAHSVRNDVTLNWVYQNPILVVFFVVERSTDGVNFTPVEEVMSSEKYFYRFKHRNVAPGTAYYRIVSYQHYGGIEYSQVQMVRVTGRRC